MRIKGQLGLLAKIGLQVVDVELPEGFTSARLQALAWHVKCSSISNLLNALILTEWGEAPKAKAFTKGRKRTRGTVRRIDLILFGEKYHGDPRELLNGGLEVWCQRSLARLKEEGAWREPVWGGGQDTFPRAEAGAEEWEEGD